MQLVNLVIFFIPLAGLCVVLGFVHPLGCGLMSGFTILVGALMTYFWVVLFRGYQQISKSHEIEEVEDYDTFAEEMTHRFWKKNSAFWNKCKKILRIERFRDFYPNRSASKIWALEKSPTRIYVTIHKEKIIWVFSWGTEINDFLVRLCVPFSWMQTGEFSTLLHVLYVWKWK